MKTLTLAVALAATLLVGCESSTEFGECVGVVEEKNPALVYDISAWNIAMGVIFFEMVVPPLVVLLDELECPVGKKP